MNAQDTYSWYLWKRRVDDGEIRFLHRSDLPKSGFTSVYGVDQATAQALYEAKDYRGFKGVVYSELLWIDCDTEEAAVAVDEGLRKLGLGFERWATGNRGAHFGVKRKAQPSQLLPAWDRAWVKARFPSVDMKLYSHLHLFRLPGAVHDKTGRTKELLYTVGGDAIVFGAAETRAEAEPVETTEGADETSIFDDSLIMGWTTPQESGTRNKALAAVAYRLAERGEKAEFTMRWLEHQNRLFSEPKPREELEKIVRYAYGRSR